MDVYPCVADEESWAGGATIEGLFGHLCSGTNFSYDEDMRLNHHKFDTPRPLERISSQVPQAGNRDSSPQITNVPNAGFDPGGSFPASHRPQPISANRSEVTPGSATPAKRPSTVGTNPRKRSQKNFTRQEPSAQGADRALGGSFSGWLEPSDEPVLSKRPVSVSAADEIDREAAARDVYPPPCLPKANRAEPAEDEHYDATASSMPAGKSTSEPRPTDGGGGGTQLRPIELLSDPSESESDDTTSDAVESSPPEARRYDNNSIHPTTSGSETQLSASASAFDDESQELGQSSPVKGAGSGSGSGQARMQQRREIYERVRHDDGFGWGREYGLFSTATRYEDDDGGADGSQEL